jgi:tRNA (guanine-N7-)-methyltransferase
MMQQTSWKNPYIDRIADVSDRIPINSSSQQDESCYEDVRKLLKPQQEVFCELGSGSGMHLLKRAELSPDSLFFGIELRYKRAYRTIEKAIKAELKNVYVLRTHASFLSTIFPDHCLNGIYMNFPDPWERKKWRKHRMFSESFLEQAYRLLKPGGFISFKTDHADYFHEAEGLVRSSSYFELLGYSTDLAASEYEKENIATEFEMLFRSQTLPIHFLSAKKIASPLATDGLG